MFVFDIETGPLESGEEIKPFDPGRLKNPELVEKAKEEHFGKLALYPTTGEVLVIGYCADSLATHIETRAQFEESQLIDRFWKFVSFEIDTNKNSIYGFNSHKFDLPFLIGRSRLLGVPVPDCVKHGRYWNPKLLDLMEEWTCHQYGTYIGLDELARAFGFGGKPEEGKNFYLLFRDEQQRAIDYAKYDILTTMKIALRMGCV